MLRGVIGFLEAHPTQSGEVRSEEEEEEEVCGVGMLCGVICVSRMVFVCAMCVYVVLCLCYEAESIITMSFSWNGLEETEVLQSIHTVLLPQVYHNRSSGGIVTQTEYSGLYIFVFCGQYKPHQYFVRTGWMQNRIFWLQLTKSNIIPLKDVGDQVLYCSQVGWMVLH